jgi:hypothetical protein
VVWCAEPSYGLHGVDRVRPQKAVVTRKAPRYLVAYEIPNSTPGELEGFERAARLAGADDVPFESLDCGERKQATAVLVKRMKAREMRRSNAR